MKRILSICLALLVFGMTALGGEGGIDLLACLEKNKKESRLERFFHFFVPRKTDTALEITNKIFMDVVIIATIVGISQSDNKHDE